MQVEDPGICQLQTSLSSLSARRNEELTLPPVPLPTPEAGARQVKTFSTGPPVTLHSCFPEYPPGTPQIPHPCFTCSRGAVWKDRADLSLWFIHYCLCPLFHAC